MCFHNSYAEFETDPTLTLYNTKLGVGESQSGSSTEGQPPPSPQGALHAAQNFNQPFGPGRLGMCALLILTASGCLGYDVYAKATL